MKSGFADQADALFLSAGRIIENMEDPIQGRMVVQVQTYIHSHRRRRMSSVFSVRCNFSKNMTRERLARYTFSHTGACRGISVTVVGK